MVAEQPGLELTMQLCGALRLCHDAAVERRREAGKDLANYDGCDPGWSGK